MAELDSCSSRGGRLLLQTFVFENAPGGFRSSRGINGFRFSQTCLARIFSIASGKTSSENKVPVANERGAGFDAGANWRPEAPQDQGHGAIGRGAVVRWYPHERLLKPRCRFPLSIAGRQLAPWLSIHIQSQAISACGSKEVDRPFLVSPPGKPGRAGSPHAEARDVPAHYADTSRCDRLPPQEGSAPLYIPRDYCSGAAHSTHVPLTRGPRSQTRSGLPLVSTAVATSAWHSR